MKKISVATTGNMAIDKAIAELLKVVRLEQKLARSPLRCLAIIGPRFEPGTFFGLAGCSCAACRAEIAAACFQMDQDMSAAEAQTPVH